MTLAILGGVLLGVAIIIAVSALWAPNNINRKDAS